MAFEQLVISLSGLLGTLQLDYFSTVAFEQFYILVYDHFGTLTFKQLSNLLL